ncbi:AraC family transcriptional regulator [Sphingobacterium shayense]|uniref:helix-turn-helix domain-containing protein n=1 Tax=Sphingobacterium shayense TaxID=626343 RepID=UPI001551DE9F|nr:helix-turn-helix domain-containing protein [Sphingobacterium shayense]NQD69450.1 AraC family transcriptional regulator [Sphingobacterium shayense]
MNFLDFIPHRSISLFVKNIWVIEGKDEAAKTNLPFFADGYPGLMFQQTKNGLKIHPHNKQMPNIFLYGQTIKPIKLEVDGPHLIIVFQLYPFVLRAFWNIAPQSINDSCYYLDNIPELDIPKVTDVLLKAKTIESKIQIMSEMLLNLFERRKQNIDLDVAKAIQMIIRLKGAEPINFIAEQTDLNIRTLERRFLKETGLSPKQFSQIIKFQASLQQISGNDYTKLTDVVYENGYSDQSHFIRVFKAFTGKTPSDFRP